VLVGSSYGNDCTKRHSLSVFISGAGAGMQSHIRYRGDIGAHWLGQRGKIGAHLRCRGKGVIRVRHRSDIGAHLRCRDKDVIHVRRMSRDAIHVWCRGDIGARCLGQRGKDGICVRHRGDSMYGMKISLSMWYSKSLPTIAQVGSSN